jgi:LmbE family N-acetylglucosaminyl deacetylase
VLAPHPDDESIGCGGTLALYARLGVPVQVVFMTDGRLGDPALRRLPVRSSQRKKLEAALVERRMAEARAALQALGATGGHFLGAPDGALGLAVEQVAPRLADLLRELRPDVVLLPFVTDRHADHAATGRCLLVAARQLGPGWGDAVDCLGYEVWSPIYANLAIDISKVMNVKRRAIACHASQLQDADFLAGVEGLNRYRAVSGMVGGEYAEAFFRAPFPLFRTLHERLSHAV